MMRSVEKLAALLKIILTYTFTNPLMSLAAEYALKNVLPLMEQLSLKLTPGHLKLGLFNMILMPIQLEQEHLTSGATIQH